MEREKTLQQRYAELQARIEELQEVLQKNQKVQQVDTVEEVAENDLQEEPNVEGAYDGQENISDVLAS